MQAEDGYLTPAGLAFCATQLDLTQAEVTAVATFYSMYRRTPTGEYLVGVCTNTLCAVMGGDAILDALQDHLGIHAGQTTDDGSVTLEHIECNAACDYAPVVMVNWEFFDNQTPSSARDLVDALRAGQPPAPTRGAPLCTFRETARILAGLPDERPVTADGQVAAPPRWPGCGSPENTAWRRRHHRTAMRRRRRSPTARSPRPSRPPRTNRHRHRRPRCRRIRHHRNRPEHNGFTRLTWHLLLP